MSSAPTPAVRRVAEELAFDRWPDQTVQDDPELIEVMLPGAYEALKDALDVEEMAGAVPRAMYAWSNGTKQVWIQLGPQQQKAIAEAIRTKILGEKS